MDKRTNIIFAVVAVLTAAFLYSQKPTVEEKNVKEALDSCMDELENQCKGLYDYSISLERENARTKKQLEECRNESR